MSNTRAGRVLGRAVEVAVEVVEVVEVVDVDVDVDGAGADDALAPHPERSKIPASTPTTG